MAEGTQLAPLGRRVLIHPQKKKEETKSGLILSDSSKQKTVGIVLAIGTEVTLVKKGDKVFFSPLHYEEIDEENFTIDERDIWAKITQ